MTIVPKVPEATPAAPEAETVQPAETSQNATSSTVPADEPGHSVSSEPGTASRTRLQPLKTTEPAQAKPEPPLVYRSANESAPTTILLIHGSHGSLHEYRHIPAHLPNHHILIPSYFSYTDSPDSPPRPYTLASTSTLLASLVRSAAKNARCAVVGVSLGAHQALHFAAAYPDLVTSVFASGLQDWPARAAKWQRPMLPYLALADSQASAALPTFMVRALLDGWTPDARERVPATMQTSRSVVDAITQSLETQGPVGVRCLVLCATKRGVLPTNDSVDAGKMWAERLRSGGEVRLVEALGCRHAWHMLRPELFAKTVGAWVVDGALPEDIEEL